MSTEVAIVIGSGFGGSVVALRLAEAFEEEIKSKSLRVIVLERGRRYRGDDFPRLGLPGEWTVDPELQTSKPLPDVARFSWQNDLGLWELRNLRGLQVAQAAGLGGGSLIYAAVHLRAPHSVFEAWPAEYHGDALDVHYRKVEDTLRLQTAPPDRWPKTRRMRRVAKQLDREADFFRPPLAINFVETEQAPACSGCGHCTIGCPSGAKNTLDRNYLAIAEEKGVEIRTLCEVIEIAALDQQGYRVKFRDHAFGGTIEEQDARHVFVCAGALNSTELLMRSRERLLAPEVGRAPEKQADAQEALEALGAPFFANGDALGVVFDADRQWQPTEGPTITSSLYVGPARRQGARAAGESWFLIQEGGMPWSLAPALNLLRSPLWLGRNQLVGRGIQAEQSPLYTPQVRARGDFLAALPGMLYRDGSGRDAAADAAVSIADDASASLLLDTLPPPARDQAETLLGVKSLIERHLLRVIDKVVARVDEERPGLSFFRWLARLDRDRLGALTKEVLEATYPAARVVLQSRSAWEMLAAAIRSAGRLDAPLENTVVLLAMGADEALELREVARPKRQRPKRSARRSKEPLFADPFFQDRDARGERDDRELNCRTAGRGPQSPLRLEVVPARSRKAQARRQSIYRRQERLMSDIARATGGELRTNPSWTIGRQPVTVHAQGGCAMGKVTDADGQVKGLESLFVMDGAVFPSSVGVNPSHTIAAVAERNIARFIARRKESPRREVPGEAAVRVAAPQPPPTAAVPVEASKVVQIEDAPHDRPAIRTGPAKLVWRERLKGFFAAADAFGPMQERSARGVTNDEGLFDLNVGVDVFRECERRGALAGQRMELTVTATVPDLDALIDGRSSMVDLSNGELVLDEVGPNTTFDGVSGKLELQLGGTAVSPLARRKAPLRTGGMVYRLQDAAGSLRVYGFKQLTDDPGLDAWLDLTTLYVDIALPNRALRGILRVSIPDFLRDQLPSFSIEKPGLAPEQQLWALGQFARFFLGRVGRIYMPEWL